MKVSSCRTTELHLFLVGTGTIGGNLLKQIMNQQETLLRDHHLQINVVGILPIEADAAESGRINLAVYRRDEGAGERADIELFIQKMRYLNLRNSVFIDCTADAAIAGNYEQC
jgi:aspartokinase/homoserine dehydrogenase 1